MRIPAIGISDPLPAVRRAFPSVGDVPHDPRLVGQRRGPFGKAFQANDLGSSRGLSRMGCLLHWGSIGLMAFRRIERGVVCCVKMPLQSGEGHGIAKQLAPH